VDARIKDFKDLIVWQKSVTLAKEIYALTRHFPREEQFGLTAQLRRAAVSVSSNIAEGHSRRGREFAHFLSIARGSVSEVESQMLLAVELGFVTKDQIATVESISLEVRRMLSTLINRVER